MITETVISCISLIIINKSTIFKDNNQRFRTTLQVHVTTLSEQLILIKIPYTTANTTFFNYVPYKTRVIDNDQFSWKVTFGFYITSEESSIAVQ